MAGLPRVVDVGEDLRRARVAAGLAPDDADAVDGDRTGSDLDGTDWSGNDPAGTTDEAAGGGDAARERDDQDLRSAFEAAEDALEAAAEREPPAGDREGSLDVLDNALLRIETQVEGDAARRIRAARNRIRAYRDARDRESEGFVVLDRRLRDREDNPVEPADLADDAATLRVDLLNEGAAREAVVVVSFYDAAGTRLRQQRSATTALSTDEQRSLAVDVDVPEDAEYYTVTAVAAGEADAATE